jgi:hypothetical protein
MGRPIYQEQFDKAVIGKSTVAEVRQYFGHPTDLLVSSSGASEMTWQWAESETKATSFIPFAAYVGGAGATGVATKIVARFRADGVLTELLRGGSTVDIVSGTVFQGYQTVGSQAATPGDLTKRSSLPSNIGERCTKPEDCMGNTVCALATDADGQTRGRCIGVAPKN